MDLRRHGGLGAKDKMRWRRDAHWRDLVAVGARMAGFGGKDVGDATATATACARVLATARATPCHI